MARGKRAAIYARVSTTGQTTENQIRELQAVAERSGWTNVRVFTDHGISGASGAAQRPALKEMLLAIHRREVDIVAAWSLDRIGRSLRDLLEILGQIHDAGADLYLYQQGIDTTTPAGKAMYQMLGVFAEFEREMIRERIKAGLARARAKGQRLGQRPIAPEREKQIRDMIVDGANFARIRAAVRCGNSTIQRVMRDARAEKGIEG